MGALYLSKLKMQLPPPPSLQTSMEANLEHLPLHRKNQQR